MAHGNFRPAPTSAMPTFLWTHMFGTWNGIVIGMGRVGQSNCMSPWLSRFHDGNWYRWGKLKGPVQGNRVCFWVLIIPQIKMFVWSPRNDHMWTLWGYLHQCDFEEVGELGEELEIQRRDRSPGHEQSVVGGLKPIGLDRQMILIGELVCSGGLALEKNDLVPNHGPLMNKASPMTSH